jgi:hypothetical protein
MSDDDIDPFFTEEEAPRPRDRKIDDAKAVLLARYFPPDGTEVYYGRQLEIALEDEFFHWITKKALNELAGERAISFQEIKKNDIAAHFYWPRRHRYPRRQIAEIISLIGEFSDPHFTRALGAQGELLADAGMARIGFRIAATKVREVDGRRWSDSNHDLDRLIERDGIRYGVEIKNQLGYIDQTEFETKLKMSAYFGVRPMFIARMMPRSYNRQVIDAGGFVLLLQNQHYPLMTDDLAKRVRERLGLPVLCIRELPDTTMKRFGDWHGKHISLRKR